MTTRNRSSKIQPHHLDRQAFVYIRQSSLQQVQQHQESTQLQYNLVYFARDLGWPEDRVQVIDEDLGKSAAGMADRQGFQRLVTEVTLDHVGLILGIEMSRLARSSRDWHQLLEVCALFGTLIADQDGIYDPQNFNDRLLLGLKGTMSEAELHVIKQRMHQGKLNKARRGELRSHLPIGYVYHKGQIVFDPDEQVQHVVRLIFRKFSEFGTVHRVLQYLVDHNILLGVRRKGKDHQELSWNRPNRMTLLNMFHHPLYAGAYSYGRRKMDHRKQKQGRPSTGRVTQDPSQWHAFVPDHCPAYISWEQYLQNQQQLFDNQIRSHSKGAPREGSALLSGLIYCGKCQRRMSAVYPTSTHHTYHCGRMRIDYGQPGCQCCAGEPIDQWVVLSVLEALKPASLEVSLATLDHLEQEKKDLEKLWQQRLERAHFESERCRRQYDRVEPENRLVARTLEKEWEEKLAAEQKLQEEYHRFRQQKPKNISAEDMDLIRQLAQDIPLLWNAETTTDQDRKAILRQVIEKVNVWVVDKSEQVQIEIHWVGGGVTTGSAIKTVSRFEQLSYYTEMMAFVRQHQEQGATKKELVELLNQSSYRPAKRIQQWTFQSVEHLVGTRRHLPSPDRKPPLEKDGWWMKDLAETLGMPKITLYNWVVRGWVQAKKTDRGVWMLWADEQELERLRKLREIPFGEIIHQRWLSRSTKEHS